MKKERKQLWIDKEIWFKIDSLLRTHPQHRLLKYSSLTNFVEETLIEKYETIQDKLILEKIAKSDLDSIISEAKEFRKIKQMSEVGRKRIERKLDEIMKRKTHTPKRK